jgi:succinate dehydrogenase/fumarate reductase-like Fe-S protein
MPEAKGEMHGCIVCGKLYQLYAAYNEEGVYIGGKVMSAGGKIVKDADRPLVACETHTDEDIQRAVKRVFGSNDQEDD